MSWSPKIRLECWHHTCKWNERGRCKKVGDIKLYRAPDGFLYCLSYEEKMGRDL